jgi:hypothetical protein
MRNQENTMFRTIKDVGRIRSFLCFLLICVSALPLVADAPPSGDTFASSTTPNINYGPSISLAVGPGTTKYIQFNLAGIPANEGDFFCLILNLTGGMYAPTIAPLPARV